MDNAYAPTATATTTTIIIRPPPPFPAPPRSVDLSALEFILGLIAVISIPALIYTFFFAIKCPPDPFRSRRQRSGVSSAGEAGGRSSSSSSRRSSSARASDRAEATKDLKYNKERDGKSIGGECPVCLSAYVEGEEVKVLGACKHAFHTVCIDMWLNSHSNCPVCRASVAITKPPSINTNNNNNNRTTGSGRDADLHQGLPDASNLV